MKRVRILILALAGAVTVAACSDTPEVLDDAMTSLPGEEDVAELVTEIQSDIEDVTTEIENSEAADELRSTWSELRSELAGALDSMTSNQAVDTETLQDRLDEFQSDLEAAGEEVGDDLRSAWLTLRSNLEQLLG
jgi:predicted nuclease with TOPRIM domain